MLELIDGTALDVECVYRWETQREFLSDDTRYFAEVRYSDSRIGHRVEVTGRCYAKVTGVRL